jgi:hypothetical protein
MRSPVAERTFQRTVASAALSPLGEHVDLDDVGRRGTGRAVGGLEVGEVLHGRRPIGEVDRPAAPDAGEWRVAKIDDGVGIAGHVAIRVVSKERPEVLGHDPSLPPKSASRSPWMPARTAQISSSMCFPILASTSGRSSSAVRASSSPTACRRRS